jgi:hypothetical protein
MPEKTKDSTTQDLYNTLVALLTTTGPDKHYSFVGKNDLRQYNISAQFIIQVNLFLFFFVLSLLNLNFQQI